MAKQIRPKYEVGSVYSIDNKSWRLAEVTKNSRYILQHEDASGIYHTMKFNESEMDNIVKTNHIYREVKHGN